MALGHTRFGKSIRFVAMTAVAMLAGSPRLSLAADENPPPQGKPVPQAPFDLGAERIHYLHDRLRITPEQEPLWAPLARVIRANAKALEPFIKEQVENEKNGSALDFLNSYQKLGARQLDGLKKFTAAFAALYTGLSDDQKRIADASRLGPMSLAGGIPQLAEELATPYPYDYAYYPSLSVAPAYPVSPAYGLPYNPALYPRYMLRQFGLEGPSPAPLVIGPLPLLYPRDLAGGLRHR